MCVYVYVVQLVEVCGVLVVQEHEIEKKEISRKKENVNENG